MNLQNNELEEIEQTLRMEVMWKRAIYQLFVDCKYAFKKQTNSNIVSKHEQEMLRKHIKKYLESQELQHLLLAIGYEPSFIINSIKKKYELAI